MLVASEIRSTLSTTRHVAEDVYGTEPWKKEVLLPPPIAGAPSWIDHEPWPNCRKHGTTSVFYRIHLDRDSWGDGTKLRSGRFTAIHNNDIRIRVEFASNHRWEEACL